MFLFFLSITNPSLWSQVTTRESYTSTNKGVIRALVLFAEITTAAGCTPGCGTIEDNWEVVGGVTQVPEWADDLFDDELSVGETPTKFLSKFYYEASFGEYILLGDYYDKVLQVPCTYFGGCSTINEGSDKAWIALSAEDDIGGTYYTKNGHPLIDFDMWDLRYETEVSLVGQPKTSGADGYIDLLIVIWRNNNYMTKSPVAGVGTHLENAFSSCGDMDGFNNATAYNVATYSEIDARGITMTEHLHALYGGNGWHTAGGAGNKTFLSTPASFGLTGQAGASSKRIVGWDRNDMGWENPNKNQLDANYISCGTDASEIITDFTIENIPNGGIYTILDHQLTGDAIRIKLPHINWAASGDVKNQYLWLENHQLHSVCDFNWFYENAPTCQTQNAGLLAYIQVGKDIVTGSTSTVYPSDGFFSEVNALGDYLFPISAEGNYDFAIDEETTPPIGGACDWGNNSYIVQMYNNLPNPFTGSSDQFGKIDGGDGVFGDTDPDPAVYYSDDITIGRYKQYTLGGAVDNKLFNLGDDKDAFNFTGNKKISIGSNPASTTIYTYRSNPYSAAYPVTFADFENRTIYLNGLSIEILGESSITLDYNGTSIGSKALQVEIRWDDYTINNDVRWCGNIVLQNDIKDPLDRQSQIILAAGKTISLERGKSPTQHLPEESIDDVYYFTDTTFLTLKSGTKTTIKNGSSLLVKERSVLIIEDGAELILEQNTKLHVQNESKIILQSGGSIKCTHAGAKIIVDNGGILLMNGNDIQLNNSSARLELKGGGTIETADNIDFTFNGTGYLYYYKDGIFDLGINSNFILQGDGDTDRKMWVGTNALLYIANHNVTVNDCRLDYNSGATFKMSGSTVTFDNVFVNDGTGTAGHAIYAYDIDDLSVYSTDFTGFSSTILLEDIDVCPNDINVKIDYSTFVNHDFAAIEAYNVERMRFFTSTATGQTGVTAGLFLEDVDECLVDNSTITDYTLTSVDAGGIFCHRVGALIIDGSSIRDNTDGIEARATNVFVRNSGEIKNNTHGIYMMSSHDGTTNPDMMYRLVVGDEGCGWIINNSIGVLAEDILLDIDQQIHANASGDPFDIHPNRFDGNSSKAFEICYDNYGVDDVSDPIPANHNYWTSGTAPSTGNYDIGFDPICSGIDLDATIYYPTQPTNCDCIDNDCNTENTSENIQLRLSETSCNYLINKNGGGRISIANQYRDGYLLFIAGDYNYAYQKFNWLKNRVAAEYSNGLPDGVCKQLYISSITLKELSDLLATIFCQYPFWIDDREAVYEVNYGSQFLIFPNPAQTIITLGSINGITANYRIYSLAGAQLGEGLLNGSITLDVTSYSKGIYMAVFYDLNGNILESQKIALQ